MLAVALPLHAQAPAPPPRLTADQMISMVKKDLSQADEEQRKADQDKPKERAQTFGAAVETKQQRLAKGMAKAFDNAPNKWYQAAKIEDVTPPGADARKVYKITTALGTYCVRYADKNRAWDHGQANLGEPLIGACPHEF
jgi:hypothetical protein